MLASPLAASATTERVGSPTLEVGIPSGPPSKECPLPGSDRSPVGHFTRDRRADDGTFHRDPIVSIMFLRPADIGILRGPPEEHSTRPPDTPTSPPESADLAQRAGVTPSSAAPKKSRSLWVWAGSAALVGLFAATIAHEMDTQQKKKAAELPYFPATP